jgi:hypothetical protein
MWGEGTIRGAHPWGGPGRLAPLPAPLPRERRVGGRCGAVVVRALVAVLPPGTRACWAAPARGTGTRWCVSRSDRRLSSRLDVPPRVALWMQLWRACGPLGPGLATMSQEGDHARGRAPDRLDGLTSPAGVTILGICLPACVAHACMGRGYDREGVHPLRKRMVSLFPAFERPALPVLPRRSRCLVRPNC